MRNGSGPDHDRRERRRYKRTHVLMAGDLVSGQRATRALVPDSEFTLRLAETVNLGVEVAWRSHNRLGLRFRDLPEQISSIFAGLLPEDCLATA